MESQDSNMENELDETTSGEEVKSGLKIRTNLKAGALVLASRVGSSGHGETMSAGMIAPQLDMNIMANVIKY